MTLRKRITVVILLALVTVGAAGRALENWVRSDHRNPDLEDMAQLVQAVANLLSTASAQERQTILESAHRAGWRLSLAPSSITTRLRTDPLEHALTATLERLFPPDEAPPLGGWHTFLNGERVIAAVVDDETILMISGLPNSMLTGSFLQGAYYFVALVVLICFFSIFAVLVITEPIKRIADAATESDLKSWLPIFEERGAMEIVALARALNGMRHRIRTMMDTRTRMLRGISHDLRTPLTRIRLRLDRMDESSVRTALLSDVDHVEKLLAQSLNYLRDDYATEPVERVDVASILNTVCCDFSDVGFVVRYIGPNKLIANCRPVSISRAVTNLCENAVKFASTVEVQLHERQHGFVITVSDDGPGIPPALRERVFEPFFKIDSARADGKAGFGLGLSIVSDIAQSHRGSIELLARSPQGLIARMVVAELSVK